MIHPVKLAAVALAASLLACGGSGAQREPSRDGHADSVETAEDPREETPLFTLIWRGGFAGFDRRLEIFKDRRARAEDNRSGQRGEIRLGQAEFDSLFTAIRPAMTHSAGPFRSRITDDFHFTLHLVQSDSLVTMEGEANGFPESFRPIFYELTELTGRILFPGAGVEAKE
jgi:hypothetical protein